MASTEIHPRRPDCVDTQKIYACAYFSLWSCPLSQSVSDRLASASESLTTPPRTIHAEKALHGSILGPTVALPLHPERTLGSPFDLLI